MKPAVSLKCFYCEREFIPEHDGTNKPLAKTIDHIIPLAKRGNNSPDNIIKYPVRGGYNKCTRYCAAF